MAKKHSMVGANSQIFLKPLPRYRRGLLSLTCVLNLNESHVVGGLVVRQSRPTHSATIELLQTDVHGCPSIYLVLRSEPCYRESGAAVLLPRDPERK